MSNPSAPRSRLADRMFSTAKKALGGLLGDDRLRREGELHDEKADAEATARHLESVAAEADEAAALSARERELDEERARLAAEEQVEARTQLADDELRRTEHAAEAERQRAEQAAAEQERRAVAEADAEEKRAAAEHRHDRAHANELKSDAEEARRTAERLADEAGA